MFFLWWLYHITYSASMSSIIFYFPKNFFGGHPGGFGRGSAHNIFVDRQRPEDVPMRSGRLGQLRQRKIIILKYPAVDRRQHPEEILPAPCPLQLLSVVISWYTAVEKSIYFIFLLLHLYWCRDYCFIAAVNHLFLISYYFLFMISISIHILLSML